MTRVHRFYLYKLPGQFEESFKYKRASRYMYITSNSASSQWKQSEFTLEKLESMAGQTLTQAYFDADQTKNRLLVAYNDEPPNASGNSKKGHLKGVVVADQRSGFWLVHSVPLYPNISCKQKFINNIIKSNSTF